MFCLNALSDSVADEESVDDFLSNVFGSSLFADLANMEEPVPMSTKRTAVTMISNYTAFFERHAEHLPAMLNYLFTSLGAGSSALANVAAKAIFSACSSCRKMLTWELGAFLHQYEVLLTWDGIETSTKEKVVGAISAIVEALPTHEEKIAPLAQLIQSVEKEAANSVKAMEASQAEDFQESGLCALRCLASMGKVLQAPDEAVIDLDANGPKSTFWTNGQGALLQARVIRILETITGLMKWNSDIIEAGCQILRAGYKERTPGLFVFSPKVTVDFVLATRLDTARLDQVLDTAGVMLGSRSSKGEAAMINAASSILVHLLGILATMNCKGFQVLCVEQEIADSNGLDDPSSDPEASAAAIELVDRMLPHYLSSMMNTHNIQLLFDFLLRSLTVPEVMPKRSAAHCWVRFPPFCNVAATYCECRALLCRDMISPKSCKFSFNLPWDATVH